MARPPEQTPVEVSVFRGRQELVIRWADGHRSVFPFVALRWLCPCALCQGEWGRPGLLATLETLSPAQTTLVDLRPVGHYALQPVWQDGHDAGLYAWDYLRQHCPCPACQARRPAGSSEPAV
jgi:DUF971 family protein